MKGTRFLSYIRTTALGGFAVAALGGLAFTLSSCSGGGSEEGNFIVTASQFAGGKSFVVRAGNLWCIHATEGSGLIQSPTEIYTGEVQCMGEITTGMYDMEDAGIAKALINYRYDKDTNTGTATWSWNPADPDNVPTPALAFIATVHNLPGGNGGNEGNNGGNEETMGGIGEEGNPAALAEHMGQSRVVFDFNHGTCVFYCPCGAQSQTIPFSVRAN